VTSAVKSTKPRPEVCTVSRDVAMVVALTVDGVARENDSGEVTNDLSKRRPGERP
jgi:hypothetical protein